ncbi:MAG TPA: DUF547 domain-containing protein [Pirellulaceae bacterium]|nr:DUF547 domain-containing protein [Planctomycetales bacterium]MCB9939176.1 DUF547 domain-containing protein [Planctomycetaceae bacterium]HRX77455.1 DUF547 domain-containing protein [Pirellulaceae bacterium]
MSVQSARILTFVISVAATCSIVEAGPTVTVGRNVVASERVSIEQIDHSQWDLLLKRYVDQAGNVNYTAWKRSAEDVRQLDAYLAHLSQADPRQRAHREATLAFWINAYNAVTIKGILREYPTTSIRNHTARLFGYNIWKDLHLIVGGDSFYLEQMEHEILRKMSEPRIHFAIVCASKSCPKLRNEAYVAQNLEAQLTENARDFFANANNFRYDPSGQRFYLSSILSWFADDFGSDQANQLGAIAPYLPIAAAQQAANANAVRLSYLDYDWDLNDQATVRSARR